MKTFFYLLSFIFSTGLSAQNASVITLYGTPENDSSRTLLVQYDTIKVYSPAKLSDASIACSNITPRTYPEQHPDDYLHEERFEGMDHVVLFDHIATRKILNVLIPTIKNPDANLCGVDLQLTNPETGQVVIFYDIFNWVNKNGKGIFNTNKEVYNIWKFDVPKMNLPVKMTHIPTGSDYAFGHEVIKLKFLDLYK